MRNIKVEQGSLTDGNSLLLLNASNTNANLGTGVSSAISKSCGKGYQQHIHELLQKEFEGPMEPGNSFITDAGTHQTAKYVAHAAVMDYRNGFQGSSFPSKKTIELCYLNTWKKIETLPENDISVAIVALGAGTGNIGLKFSLQMACETLKLHFSKTRHSLIGDLTFYGYEFHEYVNVIEVVSSEFGIILNDIPKEIFDHIYKKENQKN